MLAQKKNSKKKFQKKKATNKHNLMAGAVLAKAESFFALTTSCRFARAYRSRTNLITKHSSLDLFYQ
ncbi:hypothetical protein F6Y05_00555 [Bacillus megaterium]|nr:hypothetical protein [Priestia megaterium]